MSRSISDLEAHLRTRLLNRTTRRIALTEAGEVICNAAKQILAYVDQAELKRATLRRRPSANSVHAHESSVSTTWCRQSAAIRRVNLGSLNR